MNYKNASRYSISITFLLHREPVRKFPMFHNPLYAFCISNYSMKQLISWKTFQKWDKEVSLCGGLCSLAVRRGLCGIALPQVKFLGVVETVPGASRVWFFYTLYVIFSYLSLQYQPLSLPSYSFHAHIRSRFSITSHKSAPCPLYLLLFVLLHCSLLSSCWALLLPLCIIAQISTAGMCRHLACYHYTCTMCELISHLFLSHPVCFGDYSIFKILYKLLLGLICHYHPIIPSCQFNINIF